MILRAIFRAAFAVCILIQTALFTLLVAFILHYLFSKFLIAVVFIGPFLAGAGSYKEYQWLTRAEAVRLEAERWLAERRHPSLRELQRRRTIKRWAVWIPTAIVVLACVFFDGIWALGSHLLHPNRGRLIGYEVSIPLNWTICYNDLGAAGSGAYSIVVAARYRGLLLAGNGRYLGQRPPFSVSTMNFRSEPAGDPLASNQQEVISTRTLPLGKHSITCWEERPPHWMTVGRYIRCSTPEGDFSAAFNGSDDDASEFYRTLAGTKPTG